MTTRYLDIHVLQTLPPSNANRDDTGRPKTATFGGALRARVSSQSWKRAARQQFSDLLPPEETAVRTLRVVEALSPLIAQRRPDWSSEQTQERAAEVLKAASLVLDKPKAKKDEGDAEPAERSKYLMFLSQHQLGALADIAATDEKISKREAKSAIDAANGVAVSLFGRMVADATDLKVDSAVQVAHALSTHAVDTESDYFTAVDDYKEEGDDAGAGMIGNVDFNSSTMYRFATVNIDQLSANLDDDTVLAKAVTAFVEAFVMSMPTGKRNTFANNTVPDGVVVQLREGRSTSFAPAFENAVPLSDDGYLRASCERLAQYCDEVQKAFVGEPVWSLVSRVGEHTDALAGMGEQMPFTQLVERVASELDHVTSE